MLSTHSKIVIEVLICINLSLARFQKAFFNVPVGKIPAGGAIYSTFPYLSGSLLG